MITLEMTFKILDVMAAFHPRRITSQDISLASGLHLRSTQRYLAILKRQRIVSKDDGQPIGWRMTECGYELHKVWEGR